MYVRMVNQAPLQLLFLVLAAFPLVSAARSYPVCVATGAAQHMLYMPQQHGGTLLAVKAQQRGKGAGIGALRLRRADR